MTEPKTCKICGHDIKEKEEDYYLIQYYHEGVFKGKEYFHKKCFDSKITGDSDINQMKRKAMELIEKTSKMVEAHS